MGQERWPGGGPVGVWRGGWGWVRAQTQIQGWVGLSVAEAWWWSVCRTVVLHHAALAASCLMVQPKGKFRRMLRRLLIRSHGGRPSTHNHLPYTRLACRVRAVHVAVLLCTVQADAALLLVDGSPGGFEAGFRWVGACAANEGNGGRRASQWVSFPGGRYNKGAQSLGGRLGRGAALRYGSNLVWAGSGQGVTLTAQKGSVHIVRCLFVAPWGSGVGGMAGVAPCGASRSCLRCTFGGVRVKLEKTV